MLNPRGARRKESDVAGEEAGGGSALLLDHFKRVWLFLTHGWLLLRAGVLRWRLETFGLYMPSLPEQRPWWRVNGRMALALLRQRGRYAHWLSDMRLLSREGPAGWWKASLGSRYPALRDYLELTNRPEPALESRLDPDGATETIG